MTPANPDALADALSREPVELADDITPQEVMRLALDGIDLAYRAHGNNARVSMLAVQADWIMQHLARTEAWAKDEQAKRHAAEDRLVEVRSRAAAAEARAAQLQAEVEALKGTVAVPLEPTDGMQQDGLAALEAAIRTHGKPSLPGFAAAHVYRAMVAARPSTTRGEQADA